MTMRNVCDRRAFLKGTAWMGVTAAAAGCLGVRGGSAGAGKMATFAAPPLKKVRVGIVGLGSRGAAAVPRLAMLPGVEIAAMCDRRQDQLDDRIKLLKPEQRAKVKFFLGEEAWKDLCEYDGIDVVYNTTPWRLHAPIGLRALECGKHAFIEVPAAMTLDECWALVEASERYGRHCMMLENCCYGETELLALNLCRQGLLGEIVHGEGAYIHDLRLANWHPHGYTDYWRLKENAAHGGNRYPTHGLGPVCQYMNINRGDRLDYLVSMESRQAGFEAYARAVYPGEKWKTDLRIAMGDMNSTLIRTALGRTILVQHNVTGPRPYSRINLISGTRGILCGYPYRVGWTEKPEDALHEFFDEKKAAEVREKYAHPLWKAAGEIGRRVGGHDGMDFLMDLRWAYCLQNGLPLDMNVYDLAAWSSLCELTERSVRSRSRPVDVPDFTLGAWKTTPPLGIESFDPAKLRLDGMTSAAGQMSV